jgi:cytochrome c-type biogenesis protein CcmH/NrfF
MRHVALLLLLCLIHPAFGQDAPSPGEPVSFDQVNAIAERMFCPECENIPLDKCGTPVCVQWKGEIADRLAAGQGEAEIIAYFVDTFGERVVAVPQDPALRALALLAPWALAGVVALLGAVTLWRLRRRGDASEVDEMADSPSSPNDAYRARLERDLSR